MVDYTRVTKEVRKDVIRITYLSKTAHLGSALSCVDILSVLYFDILKIDPKNPDMEERDRLIFSKGHAASALYATLSKRGFFPKDVLNTYCQDGTKLPGHATKGVPGVEVSVGSLGHGLSIASGMALSGKRDRKPYRVFAVLSDGECDEGSTWEAALFAGYHCLDNLVVVVDCNQLQGFGTTKEVLDLEPFDEKWAAFRWSVKEIDGHNFKALKETLSTVPFEGGKPSVILARTIKGKGISFLENKVKSHYVNLTDEEYQKAIKDLI